jgi:hypothetical protein
MPLFGNFKFGQYKFGKGGVGNQILNWTFEVDWNNDNFSTAYDEAAYMTSMHTVRGRTSLMRIDANGMANGFDRVSPGTAAITLNNRSRRFDPFYAAGDLYGLILPGRLVRIKVQDLTTTTIYPVFYGKIADIQPITGEDSVTITCVDALENLQRYDANITVQTDISLQDAIELILDSASANLFTAELIDDVAGYTMPYWWSEGSAMAVIDNLRDAFLGEFFVSAGGAATYYNFTRDTYTVQQTLTQDKIGKQIALKMPWETVRNAVQIKAHPRAVSAEVDLWTLADKPEIGAGDDLVVWASYTYNNANVGAATTIDPVANTDYTMNAQADGGGADLTGDFTVTLTDFGQTGKLVIHNGGTGSGFVTLLKMRGTAVYELDPSTLIQEDATSQTAYEKRHLKLDGNWLQSTSLGDTMAKYLLARMKDALKFPTITLEDRPDEQFHPDLFNVQPLNIDEIDLQDDLLVAYIEHEWLTTNGQRVRTTFGLEPFILLTYGT